MASPATLFLFIHVSIFSDLTAKFKTLKLRSLFSGSTSLLCCCFRTIACITFFLIFLLDFHLVIADLYCRRLRQVSVANCETRMIHNLGGEILSRIQ